MMPYGAKELAASFRTVRGNTLEAAREIPEDQYGFRPHPDCRTVEKLLTHIALVYRFQHQVHAIDKLDTFEGFDFPTVFAAVAAEEAESRTKQEVIDLLEKEGDVWASFLDGVTDELLGETVAFPPEFGQPPKSRFEMLLSVKEHEMHHRGQLMVYQRLLGMVPHLTRAREERMAEQQAKEAGAS